MREKFSKMRLQKISGISIKNAANGEKEKIAAIMKSFDTIGDR